MGEPGAPGTEFVSTAGKPQIPPLGLEPSVGMTVPDNNSLCGMAFATGMRHLRT